jgi:hypothetical protein
VKAFTVPADGSWRPDTSFLTVAPNSTYDRQLKREEPSMPNCIVVVQFDLPKRTEEMAVKGGTSTAPTYRDLARKGLIRKDYLNGENGTGGVYLWDSRESAQAWFTEAKVAELTGRFGVRPRLTWYDTHVTVDNLKGETRVNGKAIEEVA